MGSFAAFETAGQGGRPPGKIDASLNEKLQGVKWGEYRLGDLFDIESTLSFNAERLVAGNKYDYVTRTSLNQGILQTTGFVNAENINAAGCWSLGLLQMDFFYRRKPWYAGQFVRKIIPKIKITEDSIPFLTTILNRQKKTLLSVLVRNVDKTYREITVLLPIKNGQIDFEFMEAFIRELEEERIRELTAYLTVSGFDNYELSNIERKALEDFNYIRWQDYSLVSIFNRIQQGRRLKKEDQISGEIPFVMSGTGNNGVVNYVSNPVAEFPANSITVDIFGNTFYRNYSFGAGDDTGVYWNDSVEYTSNTMLFFTTSIAKSLAGKFSYGKKLRSSQSLEFMMKLPIGDSNPDYSFMNTLISAFKNLS